jgi:tRNA pseudouridine13 synthase
VTERERPPAELEDALTFRWSDLPPLTSEHPGTGGTIRAAPDDFQVEELPLYLPEGNGSHTYLLVEKVGLTTRDLVTALVAEGVSERSIGVAGLKDKVARTVQWLSVPRRVEAPAAILERLPGVRVLEESRHRNKLGIGHLRGNRFTITLRGVDDEAATRARTIVTELAARGVPNYVGPQRFGRFGRNAVDGWIVAHGGRVPGSRVLQRFFVAALQSRLFNELLAERVREGLLSTVLAGDWARKHDTGGTFEVIDVEAEAPRAAAFALSATLPLHGTRVKLSGAAAGERERAVLERFSLRWEDLAGRGDGARGVGRRGDRRLARLPLGSVDLRVGAAESLTLAFELPKGSYATTLLREVMKVEVDAPLDEGEGA